MTLSRTAKAILMIAAAITLPASLHAKAPEKAGLNQMEWNRWYTVTLLPSTRYAYYQETASRKQGRIHFQTQMWKSEEGFINNEQLGAFSSDDDQLTPLFYHFHAVYRGSEIQIDGTAEGGRLKIQIRRNGGELPLISKGLPSKAIFSSMFPLWLRRQIENLPAKQLQGFTKPFLAVLEDNQDAGFPAKNGRIHVLEPDEFARSSGTIRVRVQFNGQESFWYVDSSGAPARVEIPHQKTRIEHVSESIARKFLDKS